MIKILAISGSLRSKSINTSILSAAKALAPEHIEIAIYEGLGELPFYNPDYEDVAYSPVLDFRKQVREADGVMIASPEYAHGVTGVIKNALDWIVGSGELVSKPVALLNASARGIYGQASLRETLAVMDASIVEEASVTIPFIGREVDASDYISNMQTSVLLHQAVMDLAKSIETRRQA